ncbi:flagellar biosynthesis anti-sigma factor FlgM [Vibrio taketomensis]|uniref:flagellar biosynthesis anti-sigma factor FlgM n=1 Tax=Vibrio taketomensis TaxID=2572923 RepID=UPI00138A3A1C|nr:flagellar biosynthesis anti-sigma factor FlgM [Vibrio taketomensis]
MAGIDNIRSGQTLTSTSRSTARTNDSASSSVSSSTKSASTPQDAVSLSSEAKLQNQMASSASFDQAKVAAIKEAIANGSYTVDPDKLASNMIKFEKELGGL